MSKKLIVTTLLFEGFELLDVFGPLEMFGFANVLKDNLELKFVSENGLPVKSSAGPASVVDYSFSDVIHSDILVIPGGAGTRIEVSNKALVNWLGHQCKKTKIISSVCTGAALLAKTGVLDNVSATTNKMAFKWVTSINSKVDWVPEARWVESNNIYTSSGVSAGMDMTLSIIAKLYGQEVAMQVANGTEYEWHQDASYDPFSKLHGLV
ncbi:dimethyladenosine transferase [Colwellia sp. 39_35_sub15_T18]|nr:dimethyladenosine transferase [Colwellia sp. 39_35_sub15_T18]